MSRSRRLAEDAWPLVQATAAASIAWLIAKRLVDHHEPFFAPVAALVSLNASFGERGLNALRLLQGVLLGIVVGELALFALGGGYGTLALATFVALLLARVVGGARIVLAQAGVSAVLTVAVANGEVGTQRLVDALIGAGVALVFSQLLFSPQPLRLLRRVEADSLATMAAALDLAARALDGERVLAEHAISSQRELRDQLSELARMRRASARMVRHSLVWRGQTKPVVQENEDAGHLDLLGGSCLLLTRTALATDEDDQRLLAPHVRAISTVLGDLSHQPGDRDARQHSVDRALEILHGMRSIRERPDPDLTAAQVSARIAVTDLMLFAGVDHDAARAATHAEAPREDAPEVPAKAAAREAKLRPLPAWLRRWLP